VVNELIDGVIGGFVLVLVFSYAFGFVGDITGNETFSGSGIITTQDKSFSGFSAVAAHKGFTAEITQSDSYSVLVKVDDNLVDKVVVTKQGNTLDVDLKPGIYVSVTLKVMITMPDLDKLKLSGGSHGKISGFEDLDTLVVDLSGGSSVNGDGSVSELRLSASGGSQVMLSDFYVYDANVEFSGGSNGTINLDGALDADMSAGSHLWYIGSPTLGDISTSGGSTVSRK
jgi:hypothetical protein